MNIRLDHLGLKIDIKLKSTLNYHVHLYNKLLKDFIKFKAYNFSVEIAQNI